MNTYHSKDIKGNSGSTQGCPKKMVENNLGYDIYPRPTQRVRRCSLLSSLCPSQTFEEESREGTKGCHLEAPKQSLEWTQILKCFNFQLSKLMGLNYGRPCYYYSLIIIYVVLTDEVFNGWISDLGLISIYIKNQLVSYTDDK